MAYTSEIDKLQRRYDENPDGRNFAPLADAYRKAGDYEKAIQLCQKGLAKHPTYVSAHIVYGRCQMDLQDFDSAQASFQKVLELDPENVIALKALGEICEKEEHYEDAAGWFGKLLNVDPMNSDASEALGRVKGKAAVAQKAEAQQAAKVHAVEVEGQRWSGAMGAVELKEVKTLSEVAPAPPAPPPLPPSPPALEIEHTSVEPDSLAAATQPLEGIELAASVELTPSAKPLEGLESVEFDASEVKSAGPSEFTVEDASADFAEKVDVAEPEQPKVASGLPLIMPDEEAAPEAVAEPAPQRAPVARAVPMPVPDDEGAADTAALSGAQEVVTETMAELYLKQGHRDEAVRVYAALVQRNPGDQALRAKYEALTGRGGVAPSGGPKVRDFFKGILGKRLTPPRGGTMMDEAFAEPSPAADSPAPGTPTRPAQDMISLDAVFGDDGSAGARQSHESPTPAPSPAPAQGGGQGGGGGFSFDEFFGQPAPPGSPAGDRAGGKPGGGGGGGGTKTQRPSGESEDDDQFHAWLKGLKS